MKTIKYELLDRLQEILNDFHDDERNSASHGLYAEALDYRSRIEQIEDIIELINEEYVEDAEDNTYIYLDETNWMEYWGKEIEASDIEDFSLPNRIFKGRFNGYRQDSPNHYHISEWCWYRYARVRREK